MEDELQVMRDLIAQLKADNERLLQERRPVGLPDPGAASSSIAPPVIPQLVGAGATERLVFIPRDRRCPKFSGTVGVRINEWVEEAQACMRVRNLSLADQAFFLFDHLEGEAREEIKYRPEIERNDPSKIISALREVYGCSESYVALQEAFFSRKQQAGETLLEFSLALMSLLEKVKARSPHAFTNADIVVRDQFVEYVSDNALRRELKQLIRRQPTMTLLEVRGEAIRWEREGMPGGARGRSHSVPSLGGIQYGVQGGASSGSSHGNPSGELRELREMLQQQQLQINQLTQALAHNQSPRFHRQYPRSDRLICRRCQQPGHFARECNGERRPPCPPPRPLAVPSASESRSSQVLPPSGN